MIALIFRIRKVLPILAFVFWTVTVCSCTYENAEDQACKANTPDTVSFNFNVIPVFTTYCNDVGCHSGASPAGNLNLEASQAYDELTKPGTGYINTANPTHSVLYSSLISTTQPMPPSGSLDQCTINLILKWIEQGALNN